MTNLRFLLTELRAIRKSAGLTQLQLATAVGTGVNMIQRWEAGEVSPSLVNFIAWAEALGYEIDLHQIEKPAIKSHNPTPMDPSGDGSFRGPDGAY